MNKRRKLIAITMAIILALTFAPLTATALDLQQGVPTITVNSTTSTIYFGGQEWYVIGYNGTGIYTTAGNTDKVTLFLKTATAPYGAYDRYLFRSSGSDYDGSDLQIYLNEIVLNSMNTREKDLVNKRDTLDGIGGSNPTSPQALWPLSLTEYQTISNSAISSFINPYWLRTAANSNNVYYVPSNGSGYGAYIVTSYVSVRPAFSLDLSSVLFSSGTGTTNSKSSITTASGLVSTAVTSGAVKFTATTTDTAFLSLTCTDTTKRKVKAGDTVSFAYSNAQTAANKYVSCLIENNAGVLYYGKLETAAAGIAEFTVPDIPEGDYTIKLFNEQCNGVGSTDFASEPVSIPLEMEPKDFYEQIADYGQTNNDAVITVKDDLLLDKLVNIPSPAALGKTLTIKSADPAMPVTLKRGISGKLFTVSYGANLILENIIIDGDTATFPSNTGTLLELRGGKATIKDGTVLRNNRSNYGAGVEIGGEGTNDGELIMEGGKINNNTSLNSGGGAFVAFGGSFLMRGGEIKNNTANIGGGVLNDNVFVMTGGTIDSNTTTNEGGGLYANGSTLNRLGGTAKINNNTKGGVANNVYMLINKYIELATGEDAPGAGMEVGVHTHNNNNGIVVSSGAIASHAQYFFADEVGKQVGYENNQLVIFEPLSISGASVTQTNTLTYNGTAQKPLYIVEHSGDTLVEGTHYTLSVIPQINAGTYTATKTGIGKYKDSITSTFIIQKANQSKPKISGSNITRIQNDKPFRLNASGGESSGDYSFASSNAKVASIGADGLVSIKGIGTTNLTVKKLGDNNYNDSAVSESITLTVRPNPVSALKMQPSLYLVKGKSAKLTAAVQPFDAANKKVNYKSSNRKVATVTASGKVKAKKAGKVKITATSADGKKKSTCTVYVVSKPKALKKLSIKPAKLAMLTAGKTLQVKPKLSPAKATGIVPKYKSSNSAVASVDKAGVITAHKPGTAKITVTAGGKKKSFILSVSNNMAY